MNTTSIPKTAHTRPAAEVVRELDGDPEKGLTWAEAAARRERTGPNELPATRRRGPLARFALQFHSPLIYVLLAAALVTALLGDHVDAIVIMAVVLLNAFVGFVQESRAEQALAALVAMTRTVATVIRDGRRHRVPSTEIVTGDLVALEAGDKVPADLRLVEAADLRLDESALTGESTPVSKDPAPVGEVELADRRDMAYSGTFVTGGRGTGVVVAVGGATELGRIHRMVGRTPGVQTPLTRKIARFSRLVTVAILALAALTFLIGLARGQPVDEMLIAAVALAVGAIPEGLPAVVTITLALGVSRMVGRHVIIRRLPAVETLGSTTVICTDKTGTLTRNQMTVTAVAAGGRLYEVTGGGYAPHGRFLVDGRVVRPADHPALTATLTAGLACNDAQITEKDGRWELSGDPTEGALVASARKAGVADAARRVAVIPFSSARQYMATLHADGAVYVKGSVERVLPMCADRIDHAGGREPLDRDAIAELADDLGRQGLRVMAFARAELEPGTAQLSEEEPPPLTYLGLQAMQDPPREAAAGAVRNCLTAGIQVKMITGDHAATARAVGERVGLGGGRPIRVMTGAELAATPDADLPEAAERTDVFARVSPEQKLRLVTALQRRRHVVAMTGDGVNDAPALKQADIGVAMGRSGTEVAKESADMVLTDDDFASIEAAVEEGRGVFDNLVKFIVWALPANVGLGLVLVAAIVTGGQLPILPVQVLWLNMTAVLILGLPFAVEPRDADIMRRPPRDPSLPLLTRAHVAQILLVSAVLVAGAFGLFHHEQGIGSTEEARTVVVNVFALTLLAYVFNCLSLHRPLLIGGIRRNRWIGVGALGLIAVQLLYTYAPFMNEVFGSAPLGAGPWLRMVAVAVAAYAVVEAFKAVLRVRESRRVKTAGPGGHRRRSPDPPAR
ncbi:cation-translocating P-type ATPase [Thermomonospora curvata]|uniref:ATPase, P-type (Transporting), HAD superfamily, subfamily IC n=1 Tax=Thermomonospora curvata (strain ATCC 19995 / DSM 43183 / JCM 3096 / KCTC 9072 / NBRC 15933 / NCIMB 10081 / Henssen B9) TaxID=471852 RepID=D1A9G0_THECD|nr:HAD-IC family P-type ATPase [Thermomonospora curvata]ACY96856.1 ATPase, P-type (transporting), HAD superfamily, subfamily IC [Thermomonospora curvata DSM 43183]